MEARAWSSVCWTLRRDGETWHKELLKCSTGGEKLWLPAQSSCYTLFKSLLQSPENLTQKLSRKRQFPVVFKAPEVLQSIAIWFYDSILVGNTVQQEQTCSMMKIELISTLCIWQGWDLRLPRKPCHGPSAWALAGSWMSWSAWGAPLEGTFGLSTSWSKGSFPLWLLHHMSQQSGCHRQVKKCTPDAN